MTINEASAMQRGFPPTRHHWCRSIVVSAGQPEISPASDLLSTVDNNQVETNLVAIQHYIGNKVNDSSKLHFFLQETRFGMDSE